MILRGALQAQSSSAHSSSTDEADAPAHGVIGIIVLAVLSCRFAQWKRHILPKNTGLPLKLNQLPLETHTCSDWTRRGLRFVASYSLSDTEGLLSGGGESVHTQMPGTYLQTRYFCRNQVKSLSLGKSGQLVIHGNRKALFAARKFRNPVQCSQI